MSEMNHCLNECHFISILALVTVGVQCVWWWWWKWRRGSAGGGGGGGALRINEMNPCLNECHFISILDQMVSLLPPHQCLLSSIDKIENCYQTRHIFRPALLYSSAASRCVLSVQVECKLWRVDIYTGLCGYLCVVCRAVGPQKRPSGNDCAPQNYFND